MGLSPAGMACLLSGPFVHRVKEVPRGRVPCMALLKGALTSREWPGMDNAVGDSSGKTPAVRNATLQG